MSGASCARATLILASLAAAEAWAARKYGPDDPLPPGATGKVLALSGKVTELKGLASGVAGKAEALGATLKDLGAKVTEQEIRIELQADVLFDFDKADLRPEAVPSLQKVGAVINGYPALPVLIEGYTDAKGSDSYNMTLSGNRAASVKSWLVRNGGVDGGRITAHGRGETKPVRRTPSRTAATTPRDGRRTAASRSPSRRAEPSRARRALLRP
jgi:outer membrane protein OmpA-like peptidoglycan-associated protein